MSEVTDLRIVTIENGQFAENCYLVAAAGSSEAAIIDPGEEPERFLEVARRERLTIGAIWLTHGHLDHIMGVAAIKAATDAPITLHPDDLPMYQRLSDIAAHYGITWGPPPPVDRHWTHGGVARLGGAEFAVRHTPGHSPGSVCFIGHGVVFGGDVLFQGSIGRTDLPGGNHPRLLQSIRDELFTLPDHTVVYPGHGPPTTIAVERRTNPFLQGD